MDETYDPSDPNDIDRFRYVISETNELTSDFLIDHLSKTINLLDKLNNFNEFKEISRQLIRLLVCLTWKTRLIEVPYEAIIEMKLHSVLKRYIINYKHYDDAYEYKYDSLARIFSILGNLADQSDLLAEHNFKYGIVDLALEILENGELLVRENMKTEKMLDLYNTLIGFLFNLSSQTTLKQDLIDKNVVAILLDERRKINNAIETQTHQTKKLKIIKVDIVTILAFLLNDVELDKYKIDEEIVSILIEMLDEVITRAEFNEIVNETKFYFKYKINSNQTYMFAWDILNRLCRIAVSDQAKQRIYEMKGFPLILKIFRETNSKLEEQECAELICSLCFNENIKKCLENDESALELINEKLASSTNVQTINAYTLIIEMVKRTLEQRKLLKTEKSKEDQLSGHIMISYTHKDKDNCLKLNEALKSRGYKTWFDTEQVFTDLHDGMAKAVESASIVLVCFSESYQASCNCRLEVQYAVYLQKQIIPIRMQAKFKPDGWLGIIVSSKLYFDLTKNQKADGTLVLDDLFNKIEHILSNTNKHSKTIRKNKELIAKWNKEDVKNWLMNNGLSEFTIVFDSYDGTSLNSLWELKTVNVDRFCDEIDKEIENSKININLHKKLILYQNLDLLFGND